MVAGELITTGRRGDGRATREGRVWRRKSGKTDGGVEAGVRFESGGGGAAGRGVSNHVAARR